MNPLIDHTPAENLMLRDKGTTPIGHLLKATLIDLILKDVLQFQEVYRRPHPTDEVKRYVYVQKGPGFTWYVPRPHEDVFLKHFEYSGYRFLFRQLVRLAFEGAGDDRSYRSRIMHDPETAKWWRPHFRLILGRPLLTSKGEQVRNALMAQVKELEQTLVPWMEDGDPRAYEFLRRFGGNILLIATLPIALLPQFKDNAFVHAQQRHEVNTSPYDMHSYAVVNTVTTVEFDHGFESAEGSDTTSSSGGSGCGGGGDSGCSGCSGCGGCGGCGG